MRALETPAPPADPEAPDPASLLPSPRALPDGIGPCSAVCGGSALKVVVVVGLGNPGSQYAGTRHNIGWLVLDRLADRAGWAGKGRQRDASTVVMGRYRGLDLTLVKPLTYMNESGLAVRKVLAREQRAAGRPARRRRRLRAAVRQAPLPRGRRPGRSQRPALDHRRARDREVQPPPDRHRRAGPQRRRPRPHDVRARRAAAARRAARRRRRRGRGMGPRGDEQGRQPVQHVRAAARPTRRCSPPPARSTARPAPTASGGRRTGWRRVRPPKRTPDVPDTAAPRPARPRPADRRAGRDRFRGAPRADAAGRRGRLRCRRGRRRGRGRPTSAAEAAPRRRRDDAPPRLPGEPARRRRPPAAGPLGAPAAARRDRAPSQPCASGWDAPRTTRRRTGRHVGLVSVPHGAKTYLAAALAQVAGGERLVWVARDAEIGDRVAEELGAWLGDPAAVAVLEPRTALAYERSELVADETAARVAALAAWRSGRARILVAGVQALLQHTIAPADLPARRASSRLGARVHQDALLRELFDLGYVAGQRGRGSRRVRAARRHRRRLPAVDAAADPDRVLRRRDRLPARVRPDRPADGRARSSAPSCCRRRSSCCRRAAAPRSAIASAGPPRACPSAWPRTSPGSTRNRSSVGRQAARTATRALAVGDAAEVWAAHLAPATGLDHIGPGTLLVLDEPGDIAEAAEFLWRQADERRAELVAAGELPKDWPSTYLPPRDWKGRLVASRTLELTWESEPPEDAAMAARRPVVGRPVRLARTRSCRPAGPAASPRPSRPGAADGARIVLASDQAPRLADILGEAGHPVGGRRAGRRGAAARRDRARSSEASTAASWAVRTGSPSSPTASCSGPSGSGGRGRCGASSRATSSSG